MIFYALRHRATGKYMPFMRSGSTWWEPSKDTRNNIRTFAKRGEAENAKRLWEAGPMTHNITTDWETEYSESTGLIHLKSEIAPRAPDDLEIMICRIEMERMK